MPVYYFDVIQDGATAALKEGVEFSSEDLARAYALGIVSTMQGGDEIRDQQTHVRIRNEAGKLLQEVGPIDLERSRNCRRSI